MSLSTPQEAKGKIVACGLPDARVSVQFDGTLQEDVVWIAQLGPLISGSTLTCLARASVATSYYIYFRDASVQRPYDIIYNRISNEAGVANAKEWLRARNLLDTLPEPVKGEPLAKYAQAVEVFCGVKPGSLLVATDDRTITFTKSGLGRPTANGIEGAAANEAQFECVMNVTSAANLEANGLFFGFIGNAAKAQ
ncbi:hypothetical protein HZF05_14520 [Sphingomonas sp. CGMCC 1.13654]|uniref:Uncharacterized protein n=1 Tax=Sphingomonas chungangi TaxID=2683589 RepID=A0A838L9R5_9SPHN|nr:hypothetical protein [Sphingomonas chungangi]MBA2935299.1 hypothetical protein [Sphingomonas chungangi]MVW56806.1 hypothetical protein [Sphingomonas chungangi]